MVKQQKAVAHAVQPVHPVFFVQTSNGKKGKKKSFGGLLRSKKTKEQQQQQQQQSPPPPLREKPIPQAPPPPPPVENIRVDEKATQKISDITDPAAPPLYRGGEQHRNHRDGKPPVAEIRPGSDREYSSLSSSSGAGGGTASQSSGAHQQARRSSSSVRQQQPPSSMQQQAPVMPIQQARSLTPAEMQQQQQQQHAIIPGEPVPQGQQHHHHPQIPVQPGRRLVQPKQVDRWRLLPPDQQSHAVIPGQIVQPEGRQRPVPPPPPQQQRQQQQQMPQQQQRQTVPPHGRPSSELRRRQQLDPGLMMAQPAARNPTPTAAAATTDRPELRRTVSPGGTATAASPRTDVATAPTSPSRQPLDRRSKSPLTDDQAPRPAAAAAPAAEEKDNDDSSNGGSSEEEESKSSSKKIAFEKVRALLSRVNPRAQPPPPPPRAAVKQAPPPVQQQQQPKTPVPTPVPVQQQQQQPPQTAPPPPVQRQPRNSPPAPQEVVQDGAFEPSTSPRAEPLADIELEHVTSSPPAPSPTSPVKQRGPPMQIAGVPKALVAGIPVRAAVDAPTSPPRSPRRVQQQQQQQQQRRTALDPPDKERGQGPVVSPAHGEAVGSIPVVVARDASMDDEALNPFAGSFDSGIKEPAEANETDGKTKPAGHSADDELAMQEIVGTSPGEGDQNRTEPNGKGNNNVFQKIFNLRSPKQSKKAEEKEEPATTGLFDDQNEPVEQDEKGLTKDQREEKRSKFEAKAKEKARLAALKRSQLKQKSKQEDFEKGAVSTARGFKSKSPQNIKTNPFESSSEDDDSAERSPRDTKRAQFRPIVKGVEATMQDIDFSGKLPIVKGIDVIPSTSFSDEDSIPIPDMDPSHLHAALGLPPKAPGIRRVSPRRRSPRKQRKKGQTGPLTETSDQKQSLKKKVDQKAVSKEEHDQQAPPRSKGLLRDQPPMSKEEEARLPLSEIAMSPDDPVSDLDQSLRHFPIRNIVAESSVEVSGLDQTRDAEDTITSRDESEDDELDKYKPLVAPRDYVQLPTHQMPSNREKMHKVLQHGKGRPITGRSSPALADSITEWSLQEVESQETAEVAVQVMLNTCNQMPLGQMLVGRFVQNKGEEDAESIDSRRLAYHRAMTASGRPIPKGEYDMSALNQHFVDRFTASKNALGEVERAKFHDKTPLASNRQHFFPEKRKPKDAMEGFVRNPALHSDPAGKEPFHYGRAGSDIVDIGTDRYQSLEQTNLKEAQELGLLCEINDNSGDKTTVAPLSPSVLVKRVVQFGQETLGLSPASKQELETRARALSPNSKVTLEKTTNEAEDYPDASKRKLKAMGLLKKKIEEEASSTAVSVGVDTTVKPLSHKVDPPSKWDLENRRKLPPAVQDGPSDSVLPCFVTDNQDTIQCPGPELIDLTAVESFKDLNDDDALWLFDLSPKNSALDGIARSLSESKEDLDKLVEFDALRRLLSSSTDVSAGGDEDSADKYTPAEGEVGPRASSHTEEISEQSAKDDTEEDGVIDKSDDDETETDVHQKTAEILGSLTGDQSSDVSSKKDDEVVRERSGAGDLGTLLEEAADEKHPQVDMAEEGDAKVNLEQSPITDIAGRGKPASRDLVDDFDDVLFAICRGTDALLCGDDEYEVVHVVKKEHSTPVVPPTKIEDDFMADSIVLTEASKPVTTIAVGKSDVKGVSSKHDLSSVSSSSDGDGQQEDSLASKESQTAAITEILSHLDISVSEDIFKADRKNKKGFPKKTEHLFESLGIDYKDRDAENLAAILAKIDNSEELVQLFGMKQEAIALRETTPIYEPDLLDFVCEGTEAILCGDNIKQKADDSNAMESESLTQNGVIQMTGTDQQDTIEASKHMQQTDTDHTDGAMPEKTMGFVPKDRSDADALDTCFEGLESVLCDQNPTDKEGSDHPLEKRTDPALKTNPNAADALDDIFQGVDPMFPILDVDAPQEAKAAARPREGLDAEDEDDSSAPKQRVSEVMKILPRPRYAPKPENFKPPESIHQERNRVNIKDDKKSSRPRYAPKPENLNSSPLILPSGTKHEKTGPNPEQRRGPGPVSVDDFIDINNDSSEESSHASEEKAGIAKSEKSTESPWTSPVVTGVSVRELAARFSTDSDSTGRKQEKKSRALEITTTTSAEPLTETRSLSSGSSGSTHDRDLLLAKEGKQESAAKKSELGELTFSDAEKAKKPKLMEDRQMVATEDAGFCDIFLCGIDAQTISSNSPAKNETCCGPCDLLDPQPDVPALAVDSKEGSLAIEGEKSEKGAQTLASATPAKDETCCGPCDLLDPQPEPKEENETMAQDSTNGKNESTTDEAYSSRSIAEAKELPDEAKNCSAELQEKASKNLTLASDKAATNMSAERKDSFPSSGRGTAESNNSASTNNSSTRKNNALDKKSQKTDSSGSREGQKGNKSEYLLSEEKEAGQEQPVLHRSRASTPEAGTSKKSSNTVSRDKPESLPLGAKAPVQEQSSPSRSRASTTPRTNGEKTWDPSTIGSYTMRSRLRRERQEGQTVPQEISIGRRSDRSNTRRTPKAEDPQISASSSESSVETPAVPQEIDVASVHPSPKVHSIKDNEDEKMLSALSIESLNSVESQKRKLADDKQKLTQALASLPEEDGDAVDETTMLMELTRTDTDHTGTASACSNAGGTKSPNIHQLSRFDNIGRHFDILKERRMKNRKKDGSKTSKKLTEKNSNGSMSESLSEMNSKDSTAKKSGDSHVEAKIKAWESRQGGENSNKSAVSAESDKIEANIPSKELQMGAGIKTGRSRESRESSHKQADTPSKESQMGAGIKTGRSRSQSSHKPAVSAESGEIQAKVLYQTEGAVDTKPTEGLLASPSLNSFVDRLAKNSDGSAITSFSASDTEPVDADDLFQRYDNIVKNMVISDESRLKRAQEKQTSSVIDLTHMEGVAGSNEADTKEDSTHLTTVEEEATIQAQESLADEEADTDPPEKVHTTESDPLVELTDTDTFDRSIIDVTGLGSDVGSDTSAHSQGNDIRQVIRRKEQQPLVDVIGMGSDIGSGARTERQKKGFRRDMSNREQQPFVETVESKSTDYSYSQADPEGRVQKADYAPNYKSESSEVKDSSSSDSSYRRYSKRERLVLNQSLSDYRSGSATSESAAPSEKARHLRRQLEDALKTSVAIRSTQERLGNELISFKNRVEERKQLSPSIARSAGEAMKFFSGLEVVKQNDEREGIQQKPSPSSSNRAVMGPLRNVGALSPVLRGRSILDNTSFTSSHQTEPTTNRPSPSSSSRAVASGINGGGGGQGADFGQEVPEIELNTSPIARLRDRRAKRFSQSPTRRSPPARRMTDDDQESPVLPDLPDMALSSSLEGEGLEMSVAGTDGTLQYSDDEVQAAHVESILSGLRKAESMSPAARRGQERRRFRREP